MNLKLDILAFGAHPDDVELGCAGTLAKEIASGKRVGIVDLTRGELGSRGSAEIRDRESAKAAGILKVAIRENLHFRDGFFENNEWHQLKVIEILRKYCPTIVICNAISDRHVDHPKASKLVSDACFLSGLRRIETTLNNAKQDAHRPDQVYHYIQWQEIQPDIVVDISGYENIKREAILAYQSQFYDANSSEPVTPIATKNFLESIDYRARNLGRLTNVEFAEGFTVERYPVVDLLSDLR